MKFNGVCSAQTSNFQPLVVTVVIGTMSVLYLLLKSWASSSWTGVFQEQSTDVSPRIDCQCTLLVPHPMWEREPQSLGLNLYVYSDVTDVIINNLCWKLIVTSFDSIDEIYCLLMMFK